MSRVLLSILNWSEVWALLIPLVALFLRPKQPGYLKPVIFYLFAALLLNLLADILVVYNDTHRGSESISNNPLYNIHSVLRFACFSYFFILLRQSYFKTIKKILPVLFFLFLVFNFGFNEAFFYPKQLSGNLFSAESFLLLAYCMLFYLSKLKGEVEMLSGKKDFWVVTGLSIYVAISFFVFLFYEPMMKNPALATDMWSVHNVAYILLCTFISKAFYVPAAI